MQGVLQRQVRELRDEIAVLDAQLKALTDEKTELEKNKIDRGALSEDAQHKIMQLRRDLEQAEELKGMEEEQLTARKVCERGLYRPEKSPACSEKCPASP